MDAIYKRPERVRLRDFSGIPVSLNNHVSAWRELKSPDNPEKDGDLLLLGISPGKLEELPFIQETLHNKKRIYWLEAPQTMEQLGENKLPRGKMGWQQVDEKWLENASYTFNGRIVFYSPSLRLAPKFWGEILAKIDIGSISSSFTDIQPHAAMAWLPGNSGQLLHHELYDALQANGFSCITSQMPVSPNISSLKKVWNNHIPDFILSINFRGLDSDGLIFEICRALRIPLAIWIVDNPWHILSGIQLPWWQDAFLFVSDSGFVESLRNYGARHVTHCPLAAANHMWREVPSNFIKQPLFAGRSVFPNRKAFFGGIKKDSQLEKEAHLYLKSYNRFPDYHWWEKKLAEKAWPGKGGRKAGFYADLFSAENRARWLKEAKNVELRIIGDEGWLKMLPNTRIESPVDYYGKLADKYNESSGVLNVTSLLLPDSLNQRHFDVWAAGSMLFTDDTADLDIFPGELTEPIKLKYPSEFPVAFAFWMSHPRARGELIHAWRDLLKAKHLYAHRVELIRKTIAQEA